MTEEEEKQWWYSMVNDLRSKLSIEQFAERLQVSERTICNWQNGERPMGLKAVRVYLLHVELCNPLHRNPLHSANQK